MFERNKRFFVGLIALTFVISGLSACNEVPSKANAWQAVFLTSGQVYYGKLKDSSGQFYTLEDVYYIRRDAQAAEGAPQLTLIKMGNELHGPEDSIILNRDHILYVEHLKKDGLVTKRIAEAKDAAAKAPAGDATAQAETTLPANQLTPEEMEQFKEFQKFQAAKKVPAAADATAPANKE